MSKKNANMVTMRADVYEQTPLSERQSVTGVPSVLYVDQTGSVSEVEDIRNTTKMTNLIKTGSATGAVDSETLLEMASSTTEKRRAPAPSPSVVAPLPAVIPGQTSSPNPLPPLPGMTSSSEQRGGGARRTQRKTRRHRQVGGNPWAAFLASAGPAAILAGAYAALPARSSGLPAPQHSAKWRRIRARLTRRRRHH
jgi:hypothetical protein